MDDIQRSLQMASQPDLHPLYPSPQDVSKLLTSSSVLTPHEKGTLVSHCLTRAAIFADLSFFQYIIHDTQAQNFVDLNQQDDDGLVLASVIITGFGADSERDVEREECVRLLIAEGADVSIPDRAGWTPLHHAALLAPPTLIAHLLTHGCSPLSQTAHRMTALDLITAYSVIPGRGDVALFLEEAMRGEGWQSSKMAIQRRDMLEKARLEDRQRSERGAIGKVLGLNGNWWEGQDEAMEDVDNTAAERIFEDEDVYTPPLDFSYMLVFSPLSLPGIYDTFVYDYKPSVRDSGPAIAFYMLVRFACLACDHTWLEELIVGAVEAIENMAFDHSEDITYLVFWLYNCMAWLHFMRCDKNISEACESLGSFDLLEEVINTVYALLIRVTERRIDKLIDAALLEHSPLASELESVQFESEWSLFRSPFSSKKKVTASLTPSSTMASLKSPKPASPLSQSRPSSPSPQQNGFPLSSSKQFSSLRQTINRARGSASISSIQSFIAEQAGATNSSEELTTFLTALHMLLTDSGLNPVLITQVWSQVMYWASCEVFNRILTRKRYLCRSRALQIAMNLSVIEEWIADAGLPRGVESHFGACRELLLWLQCLSSMDDFSNLIATIQTMKHLNPLQMRRAVRDYRYEVNESRMGDDCLQYLAQLQKDWERQRVKLGVEALRKEINGRDRDSDDSGSSISNGFYDSSSRDTSFTGASKEPLNRPYSVDVLFESPLGVSEWIPQRPPEVLGELLESRYMLSMQLPSDPRLLAVSPGKRMPSRTPNPNRSSLQMVMESHSRSLSRSRSANSNGGIFAWISSSRLMRDVKLELLEKLDGVLGPRRWLYEQHTDVLEGDSGRFDAFGSSSEDDDDDDKTFGNNGRPTRARLTKLSRVPSSRSRTTRGSVS